MDAHNLHNQSSISRHPARGLHFFDHVLKVWVRSLEKEQTRSYKGSAAGMTQPLPTGEQVMLIGLHKAIRFIIALLPARTPFDSLKRTGYGLTAFLQYAQ